MKNTKFLKIIEQLNDKQFKELGRYISSPFFNTNKKLVQFYDYLKKYYPDFDGKNVEKGTVYKKLKLGNKFNAKLLRNISSSMLQIVNDYLVHSSLRKSKLLTKEILFTEYGKLPNNDFIDKSMKAMKAEILSLNTNTLSIGEMAKCVEFIISPKSNSSLINNSRDFENILNVVEIFLKSIALKLYADGKLLSSVSKYKFRLDFFEYLTKFIESDQIDKLPIITQTQYYKLQLRKIKTSQMYFKLKNILINNENSIGTEEAYSVREFLLSFLTEERTGENLVEFSLEQYELLNVQFELTLKRRGYIEDSIFYNYVLLCTRLRKFKEAEDFIVQFGSFLKAEVRDNVINLSLGKLYSSMGLFNDAIVYFSKVKKKHWYFRLQSLSNLVICFFELRDLDSTILILKQLGIYLKTNRKIYPFMKQNQLVFCDFMQQQIELIRFDDTEGMDKLLKEMNQSDRFSYKEWLCNKVEKEKAAKRLPLVKT